MTYWIIIYLSPSKKDESRSLETLRLRSLWNTDVVDPKELKVLRYL